MNARGSEETQRGVLENWERQMSTLTSFSWHFPVPNPMLSPAMADHTSARDIGSVD
jgi:hypothetical protein